MDEIIVSVSELAKIVSQLQEDQMEFVKICLDKFEENEPGMASFCAIKASEPDMVIDYGSIDDLPDKADEFDTCFFGTSNLQ